MRGLSPLGLGRTQMRVSPMRSSWSPDFAFFRLEPRAVRADAEHGKIRRGWYRWILRRERGRPRDQLVARSARRPRRWRGTTFVSP